MPTDLIWMPGESGDDDNLLVHKEYTDEDYDFQAVSATDGVPSQTPVTVATPGGPFVLFRALQPDDWSFTLPLKRRYVRGVFRITWTIGITVQDPGEMHLYLDIDLIGGGVVIDTIAFSGTLESVVGLPAGQYVVVTEPENWPSPFDLGDGEYLDVNLSRNGGTDTNKTQLQVFHCKWEYIEDVTGERIAYTP